MKIRFALFLSALAAMLMLSLTFAACDANQSTSAPDAALRTTDEAASPTRGDRPVPGHGTFEGAVVIRTVDDLRIVVSLDEATDDKSADGFVDRVFTLQTDTPLPAPINADYARASLTLAHGNLFIDPAREGEALRLQTSGFDLNDAGRRSLGDNLALASLDQTKARQAIAGVGLAHQLVPATERFELSQARDSSEYLSVDASACAASRPFRNVLGGNSTGTQRQPGCSDGSCDAGGPGSTGCSDGDCSVTCGDGYYSCCFGGYCKCCAG